MFGIGTMEFMIIVVVGILVLGPEHLPKIMRTFTKVMSDVRRVSTDFQRTINLEANQAEWEEKHKSSGKKAARKTGTKKKKKTAQPPEAEPAMSAEGAGPPQSPHPHHASADSPIPADKRGASGGGEGAVPAGAGDVSTPAQDTGATGGIPRDDYPLAAASASSGKVAANHDNATPKEQSLSASSEASAGSEDLAEPAAASPSTSADPAGSKA